MRRPLLAAAVALLLAPRAWALSNLVVVVQDAASNPIAGASVAALHFNNGQPDPAASRVGVTDASGALTFDGAGGIGHAPNLVVGNFYQIVAASQTYLPAVIDQFSNNPPALAAVAPSASPAAVAVSLNPAGAAGVGEIDASLLNATPNTLIFGQLGLQAGGGAAGYGFTTTDGSGSGTLKIFNVSYAVGGVYQISAFDAAKNRSAGAPVGANLDVGSSPLGGLSLDFANAPPPIANLGSAQTSGSGGGLSVYGVVTDTSAAGNPIPFIQLNFQSQYQDKYGQIVNDWRGSNTDQNGVFQLYGLIPGVTYYTSIYGGCTPSGCFQGSQSSAGALGILGAPPTGYDFLYNGGVLNQKITLKQIPASTGLIAVNVKDQFGNAFPQANVGLFPDGYPWQTSGGFVCNVSTSNRSNPGFANLNAQAATGYTLITGLPSGNYQLNVWTPYGQTNFNAGANGTQSSQGCFGTDLDDMRLTIDTSAAGGDVAVYDIYGNLVSSGSSSLNVNVVVSTGGTGAIRGTITFPSVVDLSKSPISLVLYPNCTAGSSCNGGGGFKGFSSASTGPVINYSISVSSGGLFWMQILSDYWGAVFPGGNQPQPDLTTSSVAVVDIQFFPAGRILGYLRKPDGSIYLPPKGGGAPNINAQGNNSWGNTQVNSDGSFTIGGLLPGNYTLGAQSGGSSAFPYTAKQPAPSITVTANKDTYQDLYLVDAVRVRPTISLPSLPTLNIFNCSGGNNQGDCPPESWTAYALPQGTPFAGTVATNLLAGGGGGGTPGLFSYSPSTGQVNNGGCNGDFLTTPGFCTSDVPASKTGSAYDFYLMRSGHFDSMGLAGGVRPYFVVENSSKSVIISPTNAKSTAFSPYGGMNGSTTPVQNVSLTPTPSLSGLAQVTLKGTVTAANMINQREFTELGGKFDSFLQYLPIVWVYDANGQTRAAGLVVPFPPSEQAFDTQLKNSVASGNFSQFQSLVSVAGWGPMGYEIRGLTAGASYNLVITTPNYPPFKTTVTVGAANSTTTVDANLDLNPGVSLSGLVKSTASAALGGVTLTIKSSGYGPTTVTSDALGGWNLDGLGAGQYQILAVAAGYAQAAQNIDVSGSGHVTVPTFFLPASNSSISGTVYTNNPICPAGSTCSAFGKTALQGITVLAYDDTVNSNNPTAVLPLYRAVTNSSGVYRIDGLVTGDALGSHSYKLFVNAPGYFVLNQTTQAVAGLLTGFDFALRPKPLDVNIFGRPTAPYYEFQITNYSQFSSGKAYISQSPFVSKLTPGTTDVSTTPGFVQRPDASGNNQLFLDYPLAGLTTGTLYVIHVEAQPNDPRAPVVIKEVTFGLNLPHGVCQSIDQALIGDDSGTNGQGLPNNLAPLDITGGTGGNSSGLTLPAGGVIPILSTAIPSMCMSETDASGTNSGGTSTGAFASGVYNVTLSSVNYTQKGVDLTLSYNQNGTSLTDLALFTFDQATQKWKSVPGLQTLDPIKGTISVKGLKSLASVLSVQGAAGGKGVSSLESAHAKSLMAVTDGKTYRPNAIILYPDDSGQFAILKPSQVSGGSFTGTIVKVYNFPNPFNLQTKNVNLAPGNSVCSGFTTSVITDGTVIKYEIPDGISGTGVIRIYTLSGRLVREVDAGNVQPKSCYYTTWDGKNRNGQPVANGVYYGVLSVGGAKQSSGTFKLAVIK